MVEKSPDKYFPYYAAILIALAFVVLLLTLFPYYQSRGVTNTSKETTPTTFKNNHINNQQFGIEFDLPPEFTQIGPYPNSNYTFSAGDFTKGNLTPEIAISIKPRNFYSSLNDLLSIEANSSSGLPPKISDFKKEKIGNNSYYRLNEENFEGQYQMAYYFLSSQYLFKFNLRLDIGEKWQDPAFRIQNEEYFQKFMIFLNSVHFIN